MKYVFIVNNTAGNRDALDRLNKSLSECTIKADYEIHLTTDHKDATLYVEEYSNNHVNEEICFVSCGGDGTINEVATALVGKTNKYLGVMPFGSGNDFVKYYNGIDFTSVQKLFKGTPEKIDIMKINEYYCINMCGIGFEAMVGSIANQAKAKGLKNPYNIGLRKAIFKGRFNDIKIVVDGEQITKGKMIICTLGNCQYAGGKYKCSPRANNKDGLIDVVLFHSMSLLRFLTCIKKYERGEHLEYNGIKKKRVYRRGTHIEVSSKKPIDICIDGEIVNSDKFDVSILPQAINLIVPEA